MPGIETLFWLALAGATALVWAGILVRLRPAADGRSSQARAAAWLLLVAALLPLALGDRAATPLGLSVTAPGEVYELATLLTYVAGALAGLSLVRGEASGLPRVPLAGWYLLNGTVVASSLLLPVPEVADDVIVMTLVVHALAAAHQRQPDQVVTSLRRLGRTVVVASLVGGPLMPEWTTIPDTARQLGIDRLSGVTPHPNSLAMVAALTLALEVFRPRGRSPRVFGLLSLLALAWTQSTAGLAVLLALAFAIPYARYRMARVPMVFVGGIVLVAAAIATDLWSRIVESVGEERVDSFSGRSEIWDYAVRSWELHPWIGQGVYFLSETDRLTHLPPDMQQASNAHSQFFQVLGEAGLVGVAALVVLTLSLARRAWQARSADGGARLLLLAVLVVNAVVEVPIRAYGLSVLPALLSLPFLMSSPVPEDEAPEVVTPRRPRRTVPAR